MHQGALIDAFHQQCPDAIHLTCFIHCRGNIKRKLHELGIPADIISSYLHDIFGHQQGSTFVQGLVDASSSSEFDENLNALRDVWNAREEQFNSPPQFFDYFKKHKAAVFKESMIKPVRMKAGLGNPPTEYHNNSPECINHVIKMKVDHKRNALDGFCSKMKSLVDDQQNLLIRAITSRGEYRLHPVFKDFEVDHLKWFSFNETTHSNHIKKLRSAASKRMSMFQSHNSSTHQEDSSSLGPSHDEYQDVLYKCTNIHTQEQIGEHFGESYRDSA